MNKTVKQQLGIKSILQGGALVLTVILILSACGPMSSRTGTDEDLRIQAQAQTEGRSTQINNYFMDMSGWSELAPEKPDEKRELGKRSSIEAIDVDGVTRPASCTTTEYDLTKTPEKIVMQNPAAGILYPGALVQGEGYLQGPGGLKELPIRERAPMTIAVELSGAGNTTTVENINYGNYQKAFGQMIKTLSSELKNTTANMFFNKVEVQSEQQAALDLGISVKYLGQSVSGDIKAKKSSREKTMMAVFEHRAFTVSAVAPKSPADFFTSDFGMKELLKYEKRGALGFKNPPLYVSNVSYGRMLIFTVTSKASQEEIDAAIQGSFNRIDLKVKANVKARQEKIMKEASIKIISLGGDANQVESLIRGGNIQDYFSQTSSLETFVPISYVLRNVKDNSIAKVSETTKYSVQECTPEAPKAWQVKIKFDGFKAIKTDGIGQLEVYGKVLFNNHVVWNKNRQNYTAVSKNKVYDFEKNRNSFVVTLPTFTPKAIPFKALFIDSDENSMFGKDDELGSMQELLGYDADGKVLENGTYKVSDKKMEVYYTIERLAPIY